MDLDKVKGTIVSCKLCHGSPHMCHPKKQDSEKVRLDSDEPLGLIAQDPVLAQHVPYIFSMNIGPITRPCIDTFLCNPGTTSRQAAIGREDECTSRLQGAHCIIEGLEHKACMPLAFGGGLMI